MVHVASEFGLHLFEVFNQTLNGFNGPFNLREETVPVSGDIVLGEIDR